VLGVRDSATVVRDFLWYWVELLLLLLLRVWSRGDVLLAELSSLRRAVQVEATEDDDSWRLFTLEMRRSCGAIRSLMI